MTVQTGVSNPTPELTTIAVAPFFNLSSERAADGRRIAEIYASELQKIPGYEVVPVGVVEVALREQKIEMIGPSDAEKLAHALGVDAVVIGAVTELDPYEPPRLGLRVEWYATKPVNFPNMPVKAVYPPPLRERIFERISTIPLPAIPLPHIEAESDSHDADGESCEPQKQLLMQPIIRGQVPTPKPVMSYVRMFDGRDAATVSQLRDYVELSGDQRAGGWRTYLLCQADFIRFCCHRMVLEMLTLHGGQDRIRTVYGFRRQK